MEKRYCSVMVALCFSSAIASAQDLLWDGGSWDSANWQTGRNNDYLDTDGDLVLNIRDEDDDNDGVADTNDVFPLDPLDFQDSDNDGLGDNAELALGLDPFNADSDGDGITDGEDPFPSINQPVKRVQYATNINDVDNDGVADLALVYIDSIGKISAVVMNEVTGSQIHEIGYPGRYNSVTVHKIDDKNGNNAQELGVFGIYEDENSPAGMKARYVVKDSLTGDTLNTYTWPGNWTGMALVELSDLTGDGVPELGLQGHFVEENRPQLVVKDGATSESLQTYSFPDLLHDPLYTQLSDMTGDGIDEIGLYGRLKSNNKIQIKVVDGTDSTNRLPAYNFADLWDDVQWLKLFDIDYDSQVDFGMFGRRKDDGRVQIFTKSGISRVGTLGIFSWPTEMTSPQVLVIEDLNFDGVEELAVGGYRNDTERYQLVIKNGTNRNELMYNLSWSGSLSEVAFYELGDINSDGVHDVAIDGLRASGAYEINIKDLDGNSIDVKVFGTDWQTKPTMFISPDITGDGYTDIVIYGENQQGESKLVVHPLVY